MNTKFGKRKKSEIEEMNHAIFKSLKNLKKRN